MYAEGLQVQSTMMQLPIILTVEFRPASLRYELLLKCGTSQQSSDIFRPTYSGIPKGDGQTLHELYCTL